MKRMGHFFTTELTENTENGNSNSFTGIIIGSAIDIHRALGPGLLESAYEACLHYELRMKGLHVETQKPLPLFYKDVILECEYRLDLIVAGKVIVEVKSVDCILPIHEAQLLSYLKLSGCKLGLIINFNVKILKDGIRRRKL
jgi:GxxExxY protein